MSEPSESDLKTARKIGLRLDAECNCENRALRERVIAKGRCYTCRDRILAQALAARGDEERERAAKAMEFLLLGTGYADQAAAAIRDGGKP